jgi:hypothetical protein
MKRQARAGQRICGDVCQRDQLGQETSRRGPSRTFRGASIGLVFGKTGQYQPMMLFPVRVAAEGAILQHPEKRDRFLAKKAAHSTPYLL